MKTIAISDIIVPPDRQRTSFDADHLANLARDFGEIGILQPIILRDDAKTLVVGECRLRAANIFFSTHESLTHDGVTLPPGHIPYTTMGDLSELQIFQAELHENKYRKNLSVIEEAKAIARYHELRRLENADHTAIATAKELIPDFPENRSATKVVRDAEIIARHAELPEVKKAKTQNEALRAIKRAVNKDVNSTLAEVAIASYTGEHTLIHGDAREVILTLPDGEFNCICTDPPYGVGADKFSSQQEQTHEYSDSEEYFLNLMGDMLPEFYRVAAEECHLYLMCDPWHWRTLYVLAKDAGWDVWNRPLIWHKSVGPAAGSGILPRPEHGPRNTYDCILFANKGDKKVNAVYPDVISTCPRTTVSGHAAEKPASLYSHLFSRSCMPGDKVLDAFAGGGPIFPAANAHHLIATGINMSKDDYNLALTRLTEQML